jgi:hypothetical protein
LIPVVLEKDGIDPVRAVRAEKIQPRAAGLEIPIHSQLIDSIRLARIVELDVKLHTVPFADMSGIEEGRSAALRAQPR